MNLPPLFPLEYSTTIGYEFELIAAQPKPARINKDTNPNKFHLVINDAMKKGIKMQTIPNSMVFLFPIF